MKECLICYDQKKSFKYLSCKHGLCNDCYNKIDNKCPFCRSTFNKIIIIKNISQKNNKIIIDDERLKKIQRKLVRNRRKNFSSENEYLEHRYYIKKKYKHKYNDTQL